MKYIYLLLFILVFACSGSEDSVTVDPPIAVNDTASTSENTPVSISVLANDSLKNNATLNDFDSTSAENGSVSEVSNKLIYTPANNFTGTDTFSYTICDGLSNPNCVTATVTITITDSGNPVAVNDTFEVTENTTTVFTTLLNNDTIVDGATLPSIETNSTTGTVVLNNDSTVSYTAINGFSGTDTFTYTICDNDATPTCETATVTITVNDEGNPTAVNDTYRVIENASKTITNMLDNDSLIDDATLSAIDDASTRGTVVLNSNGTITYQAPADYIGEDTFTYTICDDDNDSNSCSTATITISIVDTISFNIPSQLAAYYDGVIFSEDSDLMFDELENHTKTNHTTILEYTQRHDYLYDADEDLANTDNVILMYSSESRYWEEYQGNSNYSPLTFNTEHIYPQSFLVADAAVTDLHHLRVCDADINSNRSNNSFGEGNGSTTYNMFNNQWFPGDEWKGDVARMILYLNIRYGETFSKVGSLELFLKWNIEDPVSAFEEQRNDVIYGAQGNRNPFIDNPYLATLTWGGNDAENKWE